MSVLFLDSGVGGLAYLEEFRRRNPTVSCEYLADTAWFPYGERTPREVEHRLVSLVEHRVTVLRRDGREMPRVAVIACNTASVVALAELRRRFAFPFIGVVPAVKPAAGQTLSGHIAVLATSRTSRDPYTEELVQRFARYCRVTRLGLPHLVQAAEEGFCGDQTGVASVFRRDVINVLEPSVDTVVLACTHFVRYRALFQDLLGSSRAIVDSLEGVTARLEEILREISLRENTRELHVPGTAAAAAAAVDPPVLFHTGPLPAHLSCLSAQYRTEEFLPPRESLATVLWGANNIYSVRTFSGEVYEHLRIKGKVLPGTEEEEYNPLAPGDVVTLSEEGSDRRILERQERRNIVRRWNRKRRALQAIAANVDTVLVVASTTEPSYRAAFVDRVLVMAELEGIPAAIVLNKTDYTVPSEVEEHLTVLRDLGYPIYRTIAGGATPEGEPSDRALIPEDLRSDTAGTVTVLVGRSGVGKSSLINRLVPEADLLTGAVSRRYNRGRHTTTLARQVIATDISLGGAIYIDTPGVREFDLLGYSSGEIAAGYREFLPWLPHCRLPGCTHSHEPDCAVREAVETGAITRRRYESYRQLWDNVREEYR